MNRRTLDGVDARQRGLEDALAGADVIDERRPLAVDREEREAIHAEALAALAQQVGQAGRDGARHVPRRGEAGRILGSEQLGDRRRWRLPPETAAGDVRERGGPADEGGAPVGVGRAVGESAERHVPRLVDDSAPELARLPPPVVAGVRAEDEEQAQRGPGEFVRRDLQCDPHPPVPLQQPSGGGDDRGHDAERGDRKQHPRGDRTPPGERFAPKARSRIRIHATSPIRIRGRGFQIVATVRRRIAACSSG